MKLNVWQKYLIAGVIISVILNLIYLPCISIEYGKDHWLWGTCAVLSIPFFPIAPIVWLIRIMGFPAGISTTLVHILMWVFYPIILMIIGLIHTRLKDKK